MFARLYAGKTCDNRYQDMQQRIENVAKISRSISHFPNVFVLMTNLHDLGKLSDAFQSYLNTGDVRGSVGHAWQGTLFANECFSSNNAPEKLLTEIIGLCIVAQHNHLNDCASPDGKANYQGKLLDVSNSRYKGK